MTCAHWQEIKTIAIALMDPQMDDHEAELERLCNGNVALADDVRALLAVDDEPDLPDDALIVDLFDPNRFR